ncbi:hypothetical protein HMPREF9012_1603 [Bacteroidetes bacterium oral taxon 272 str. F0290]|nr:hypothetical protein HMPREF9012_1603 [Bacteroidetes bacterium oral taxon 272 str. F0290]
MSRQTFCRDRKVDADGAHFSKPFGILRSGKINCSDTAAGRGGTAYTENEFESGD